MKTPAEDRIMPLSRDPRKIPHPSRHGTFTLESRALSWFHTYIFKKACRVCAFYSQALKIRT